jgi:hypothetical protein
MALAAIAVVAAFSAAQAPPVQATPYNCRADLGMVDGGRVAWINLLLDDNRRPVRRELRVRNGRFDGVWDLMGAPTSRSAMREASYTLELPVAATFPVDVRISGDGRPLWRGLFDHSASEVVHYPGMERFSSILLVWGAGRPITNVFDIERFQIVVRDARGVQILNERVPLPNWRWIVARSRIALQQVERQRRSDGCGLSAIP